MRFRLGHATGLGTREPLAGFLFELALVKTVALERVGLLMGDVRRALATARADTFLQVRVADVFEVQVVVVLPGQRPLPSGRCLRMACAGPLRFTGFGFGLSAAHALGLFCGLHCEVDHIDDDGSRLLAWLFSSDQNHSPVYFVTSIAP